MLGQLRVSASVCVRVFPQVHKNIQLDENSSQLYVCVLCDCVGRRFLPNFLLSKLATEFVSSLKQMDLGIE